ncbi:MAG: WYL domain-containing protein [Rikenellaceae bacterium]
MEKQRKSSKESSGQLFNRYIWLVDTIIRKGRITFEEINETWISSSLNNGGDELPLRTFHNHRKVIEQMFDINIECDKRSGYLYYIEVAENEGNNVVRQWLINTFVVNNVVNENQNLKDRILLERTPSGQRFLTQVIESMRDGVALEMTYQNLEDEETSAFVIEPYCVKMFCQRWYVIAKSASRNKINVYALDRIEQLKTTDIAYTMLENFDAAEYFKDSFGIIVDDSYEVEEIHFRAYGEKIPTLRNFPLHHSQYEIETEDDYSTFAIEVKLTQDFRQELLSHGADLEVVYPTWFRNEIKDMVQEQWVAYNRFIVG